mmetsp:Transcript_14544/g.54952  ORF Transcript_14544/g.54952 Transcript_14544/m.54952 type:complete len:279 (+) Transcript_14544:731-1567(+)
MNCAEKTQSPHSPGRIFVKVRQDLLRLAVVPQRTRRAFFQNRQQAETPHLPCRRCPFLLRPGEVRVLLDGVEGGCEDVAHKGEVAGGSAGKGSARDFLAVGLNALQLQQLLKACFVHSHGRCACDDSQQQEEATPQSHKRLRRVTGSAPGLSSQGVLIEETPNLWRNATDSLERLVHVVDELFKIILCCNLRPSRLFGLVRLPDNLLRAFQGVQCRILHRVHAQNQGEIFFGRSCSVEEAAHGKPAQYLVACCAQRKTGAGWCSGRMLLSVSGEHQIQ